MINDKIFLWAEGVRYFLFLFATTSPLAEFTPMDFLAQLFNFFCFKALIEY